MRCRSFGQSALRAGLASALAAFALGASAAHAGQAYTGMTGGVGSDSREAMMTRYGDYNLHLAFAEPDGSYLAAVRVSVRDAQGQVIYDGPSVGPYLFLEVPPGRYRITARRGDASAERTAVAGEHAGSFTYFHLR
jgi:hypothetical protein